MKLLVLTTVLICSVAVASGAQQLVAMPRKFPNVDQPLALAPDDTIQLLNRIVVDRAPGQRGTRLDVHFSTRTPASNSEARGQEADRLAQVVGPQAWSMGARRVTIAICDTRACAETREPPRDWYVYERGPGGVWQRVRLPGR
jgi:hypothetical protein